MPKSIKKKECGIMKGGNGDGGGMKVAHAPAPAPAPAPVLTAADAAAASLKTHKSYSALNYKIRFGGAITSKELYDYIYDCYNMEREGILPVTLPMTILSFMNNFKPTDFATARTTEFCKNLFGFRSTKFRELLTRNASNVSQCKKAGYPRSQLPLVCIWCGEPIYDMAECEHALPILNCAGLLGFSSNPDSSRIEHILEYGYAHRLCNQVKLDVPFLTWNETNKNWKINWQNMSQVYKDIANKGASSGYKNASSLAYTYDDHGNFNYSPLGGTIHDNSVVALNKTGAPYRGNYEMPGTAPTSQKNKLTENGEHRNKREILDACRELAAITSGLSTSTHRLAGGAKQKKSNKIKKQRGGVIYSHSDVTQRLPDTMVIPHDIESRLSQDIPGGGDKWYKTANDSKLYGLYRMMYIEKYCNTHLANFADTKSYKNQILARIITCVTPEELARAFAEAGPANPIGDALKEKAEVLAYLYKKALGFKDFKFNLGNLLKTTSRRLRTAMAVTNLKLLKDEKQKKEELFYEIWKIIDEYNKKYEYVIPQNSSVKINGTEDLIGSGGKCEIPDTSTLHSVKREILRIEIQLSQFSSRTGGARTGGGGARTFKSLLKREEIYVDIFDKELDKIPEGQLYGFKKYREIVIRVINEYFKAQREVKQSKPDRDFFSEEYNEFKKYSCNYETSQLFDRKLPEILKQLIGLNIPGIQSKIMLSALISTPIANGLPFNANINAFLTRLHIVLFGPRTDEVLKNKFPGVGLNQTTLNAKVIYDLGNLVSNLVSRYNPHSGTPQPVIQIGQSIPVPVFGGSRKKTSKKAKKKKNKKKPTKKKKNTNKN